MGGLLGGSAAGSGVSRVAAAIDAFLRFYMRAGAISDSSRVQLQELLALLRAEAAAADGAGPAGC